MTTVVVGVAAPDVAVAGAPAGQVASVLAGRVPAAARVAARAESVAVPQALPVGEPPVVGAVADRGVAQAETPAVTAETVTDTRVHGETSPRVATDDPVHDETTRRVVSVGEARGAKVPPTGASVRAETGPVMGVVMGERARRGKRAQVTGRPTRRSTLR